MSKKPLTLIVPLAILTLAIALPSAAQAKKKKKYSASPADQYVVPFSCGSNDGSFGGAVEGDYRTSISAFNGGDDARVVARVVLSAPRSAKSDVVRARIGAGEARLLDCRDLLGGVFMFRDLPDGFFQGHLVVKSSQPLDVSARYTASGQGEVSSQVVSVPSSTVPMPRDDDDVVEICHIPPGNPRNAHTLWVDESAVSAHRGHGDYMGECDDEDDDYDD